MSKKQAIVLNVTFKDILRTRNLLLAAEDTGRGLENLAAPE